MFKTDPISFSEQLKLALRAEYMDVFCNPGLLPVSKHYFFTAEAQSFIDDAPATLRLCRPTYLAKQGYKVTQH